MVTYIHVQWNPFDLWRQKKVPTLATYRYFRCVLIDIGPTIQPPCLYLYCTHLDTLLHSFQEELQCGHPKERELLSNLRKLYSVITKSLPS